MTDTQIKRRQAQALQPSYFMLLHGFVVEKWRTLVKFAAVFGMSTSCTPRPSLISNGHRAAFPALITTARATAASVHCSDWTKYFNYIFDMHTMVPSNRLCLQAAGYRLHVCHDVLYAYVRLDMTFLVCSTPPHCPHTVLYWTRISSHVTSALAAYALQIRRYTKIEKELRWCYLVFLPLLKSIKSFLESVSLYRSHARLVLYI